MDDVTIEERSAAGIERTGLNPFQDVSQDWSESADGSETIRHHISMTWCAM